MSASETIDPDRVKAILKERKYDLITALGAGGFAQVFKVKDSNANAKHREVACKAINRIHAKKKYGNSIDLILIREPEMSSKLLHPNIVRVFSAFKTRTYLFTFMELCPGGTLEEVIAKEAQDDEFIEMNLAISWFNQIASAVYYIHSKKYAHRDIKPANILFNSEMVPKLADFGFVTITQNAVGTKLLARTACGTSEFQSPEIETGNYDACLADVYALGITLYQMMMIAVPFSADDSKDLLAQKQKAELPFQRPGFPKGLLPPDPVVKLIERMLHPNPERRITSDDVIGYIYQHLLVIFE